MEIELLKQILEKVEQLDRGLNSLGDKVNSLDDKVNSLGNEVNSLRTDMNEKFDKVDGQLSNLQESVLRIEVTQQEDILSVLGYINSKLEDTAKKSDVNAIRQDLEFNVKENSLFKLELDRLKRNSYE